MFQWIFRVMEKRKLKKSLGVEIKALWFQHAFGEHDTRVDFHAMEIALRKKYLQLGLCDNEIDAVKKRILETLKIG